MFGKIAKIYEVIQALREGPRVAEAPPTTEVSVKTENNEEVSVQVRLLGRKRTSEKTH